MINGAPKALEGGVELLLVEKMNIAYVWEAV